MIVLLNLLAIVGSDFRSLASKRFNVVIIIERQLDKCTILHEKICIFVVNR